MPPILPQNSIDSLPATQTRGNKSRLAPFDLDGNPMPVDLTRTDRAGWANCSIHILITSVYPRFSPSDSKLEHLRHWIDLAGVKH
jgi:hypothetical protein